MEERNPVEDCARYSIFAYIDRYHCPILSIRSLTYISKSVIENEFVRGD